MIELKTCRTCGNALPKPFAGRQLCPTCLFGASRNLVSSSDDPTRARRDTTNWSEVFPQFELETVLRDEEDLKVWLARELDHGARPAVLQVVCGQTLGAHGGARALTARAHRFRDLSMPSIAPVLDAGDLGDAFFVVTGRQDEWLPAAEGVTGETVENIQRQMERAANAVATCRHSGLATSFDLATAFLDPKHERMILTPSALPPEEDEAGQGAFLTEPFALEAGAALGEFTLEEKVGEGGFGEVWRARQERPVRRTVALKILKHGLGSMRILSRFEVEQNALAKLDHPHIARFFQGDTTPDGRPFFAMEWIDGESITRFCTSRQVPLPERLRLFGQACEAIQHAHQNGILHRDLKASNIMVAGTQENPSVRVIDFGIARSLEDPLSDHTLLTRGEELLGTPATMSPEQLAGGNLDARTDVYGLGVLLYELLTGQLPFAPDLQGDELRRQIREAVPRKPSACIENLAASRRVRGDLDWIVMRCLEKEPERRYKTVEDLARDLERYSRDEPVDAGPPELSYRLQKFVRRNKVGLAVASVLALTLITATLMSLGSARRARIAQGTADEALQDMRGAFGELDSATFRLIRTADERRLQTVHTLVEEGTAQFSRRNSSALFTLAEAVAAAEGDERLQTKALEIWTAARALMPGAVRAVYPIPSKQWIYKRGGDENSTDHFLITPGSGILQVENLKTGEATEVNLDPRLGSSDLRLNYGESSGRAVFWSAEQAVCQVWNVSEYPPSPITDCVAVEGIQAAELSPDGDGIATRTDDGILILWKIAERDTLKRERSLTLPANTAALALSPNWRQIVFLRNTGDPGKPPVNFVNVFLEVLDLEASSQEPIATAKLPGQTLGGGSVSFIDEDTVLATRVYDLNVWDLDTNELHRRQGYWETLLSLPEQAAIAVGMRDGQVLRLSLPSLTPERGFFYHGSGGATGLGALGDGEMLASVGRNGRLRMQIFGEPDANPFEWPFGARDATLLEGGNSGELVTIHSKQLTIRDLHLRADRPAGDLPSGATLMDVGPDGRLMLLRSADRKRLEVYRCAEALDLAAAEMIGERQAAERKGILGARFSPDLREVFFNLGRQGPTVREPGEFYRWAFQERADDHFVQWIGSTGIVLSEVLATSPPLAVVSSLGWEFRLADLTRGDSYGKVFVCRHGVDNRPTCVLAAEELGWYGLGSWSGQIRRFDVTTHEELLPEIRVDAPLQGGACSGDDQWALTQERDTPPDGRLYLRAWYLGGGPPFYGIRLPTGIPTDEEFLNPGEPDTYEIGKPFPVGERSFVFQVGDELRRIDLPDISLAPERVEQATQAALGVRKDEFGAFHSLTPEEYERCVAEAKLPAPSFGDSAGQQSHEPEGAFSASQFAEMMDWLSGRELGLGNAAEAREALVLALIAGFLDDSGKRSEAGSRFWQRYEEWRDLSPNGKPPGEQPEGNKIEKGAHWKFHTCREGAAVPEGWQSVGFDDSAWASGAAPLGYGDEVIVGEVASGDDPAGNPRTIFFRGTFEAGASAGSPLRAYLRADDGAAVYVNGEEVFRLRMPDGPLDPTILATQTVGEKNEGIYQPFFIPGRCVRPGTNVVAVEIHQGSPDSSDVIFDLAVEGIRVRELRELFSEFDAEAALERIRRDYPLNIFGFPADWRSRVERQLIE